MLVGVGQFRIASTLESSTSIPFEEITKKNQLIFCESAFWKISEKHLLVEDGQHLFHMNCMVLHGLAMYKYVIEIDNNEFANQRSQDVIHKTHKSGRSIGQTKWHDEPFIETEFGLEGRLPFVSNGHPYLVVTTTKINFRENGGTTKFIQHIIQTRNRVPIANGNGIDRATIYTHSQGLITFWDQDYRDHTW